MSKTCKIILFILIFLFYLSLITQENRSDEDLYKGGVVKLKPILKIDERSLPKDVTLQFPLDLTMDKKGNIFISDFKSHNIKKFDPKGNFEKIIGKTGEGPGDLYGPIRISFNGEHLVVWELYNFRISLLDSDGKYIKSKRFQPSKGTIREMKASKKGFIAVQLGYYGPTPQKGKIRNILLNLGSYKIDNCRL